jgi:ABC-type uncharacterized transport system substrate-binding protein
MKRRDFLGLLAVAVTSRPIITLAQVSPRRPLIAVIIGASEAASERWRSGLPEGLKALGLIEGRDYDVAYRYADGDMTRLPALTEDLIRLKPTIIVAGHTAVALAAQRATASIPIVTAAMADPLSVGLAASVARPGGNVTGIISALDTLVGKQLEFGLELMPGTRRAGMLVNVNNLASSILRQGAETAALAMAVDLISIEVRAPSDIDTAFQALTRERVRIVIVPPDAMFLNERRRIAELAIATQLPFVYGRREHVEDGGLMSYGPNLRENFRRAAAYVDKILKGAKPADLPFEQPTRFELVINLRAAKALGVTITESFLLRADQVIE